MFTFQIREFLNIWRENWQLIEIQVGRGNSMNKVGYFNTFLSRIDSSSRPKIKKEIKEMSNTVWNWPDRQFENTVPKKEKWDCILCSNMHEHLPRSIIKQIWKI